MVGKKNFLIGKIGRTVKFTKVDITTGGGNDLILFSTMSRIYPEFNFYFVGPNELYKIEGTAAYEKMFPNHNVYSVYEDDKELTKDRFHKCLENIERMCPDGIDAALFFSGMASCVNVPGLLKKPDGSDYSILNAYANYVGPYIYTINKLGCPLYIIAEDARYITINGKDLYNREKCIFSQWNGRIKAYKHILNEHDIYNFVETEHPVVYSHIEKIPLMGVPQNWREGIDLDKKVNGSMKNRFFVLSNGCGTAKINHAGNNSSRLPVYIDWVHKLTEGTEYEGAKVYGNWDTNIYEEYDWIKPNKIVNLTEEISECRYSLVYSQVRGFVTAKAYELITLGIIPFIHPDYDPERLLGLPEFLYVKTPQEMLQKMRRMDENPEGYLKVINMCMDVIKPDWLDGSLVTNGLIRQIADLEGWPQIDTNRPGVENIFTHFSKDVFDYTGIEKNKKKK